MRVSNERLQYWANVTHPKNEFDEMALDLIDARQRIAELEAQLEAMALENGKLGYAVRSPELYQCIHDTALDTAARLRRQSDELRKQSVVDQKRIANQRKELNRYELFRTEVMAYAERVRLGGSSLSKELDSAIAAQRQKEGE